MGRMTLLKRVVDLASWSILGGCLVSVSLVVCPALLVPFRDEKLTLMVLFGGLATSLAVIRWILYGPPSGLISCLILLSPLFAMTVWRFIEAWSQPGIAGVSEYGLPIKVDYLIRILIPFLAAWGLWLLASSCWSLPQIKPKVIFISIFLLFIQVVAVGIEIISGLAGNPIHPFFFTGEMVAGQIGIKVHFFGSLGNPNFLASHLALLFFPVLSHLFYTKRLAVKVLLSLMLIATVGIIFLCRSKGVLVTLLGSACILGTLFPWRNFRATKNRLFTFPSICSRYQKLLWILTIMFFFVGCIWFLSDRFTERRRETLTQQWIQTFQLRGESIAQRFLLAYAGVKMWEESPWLGIGPGEYRLQFLRVLKKILDENPSEGITERITNLKSYKPVHTHNEFLECLVEWGVVGYSSMILFLVFVLVTSILFFLDTQETDWRQLGLVGGVITGLLYSCFEFPLNLPTHLTLIVVYSGIAFSKAPAKSNIKNSILRTTTGIRVLLLFIPSGLWISSQGIAWGVASTLASHALSQSKGSEASQNLAVSLVQRANLLDPGNPEMGILLAQTQWKVQQRPQTAILTLRRTRVISDDPLALMLESRILIDSGRIQEALNPIESIRQVAPGIPGMGYLEGRVYEAQKSEKQALSAYQRDIQAVKNRPEVPHPDLSDLYFRYASSLERAGNYSQALTNYQEQVRILEEARKDVSLPLLKMAKIHRDQFHDFATARNYLERALESSRSAGNTADLEVLTQELQELSQREKNTQ